MPDWEEPEVELVMDGVWLGVVMGAIAGLAATRAVDALSRARRRILLAEAMTDQGPARVVTSAFDDDG